MMCSWERMKKCASIFGAPFARLLLCSTNIYMSIYIYRIIIPSTTTHLIKNFNIMWNNKKSKKSKGTQKTKSRKTINKKTKVVYKSFLYDFYMIYIYVLKIGCPYKNIEVCSQNAFL